MDGVRDLVDYYALLRVDPGCTARTLEVAYHYYAKLYHPDNPDTADVDKFTGVIEAYKALRDPQERAEYDRKHREAFGSAPSAVPFENGQRIDERTALNDADIHTRILLGLYKRRREKATDAGIAGWLVQETLNCTDDEFDFHIWYLRAKGFVDITEQGTLAITIAGVDHVIASSQASVREKLRLAHLDEAGARVSTPPPEAAN
ncbi:J domain-containing protein [Tsuneonella sp. HG249]